MDNTSVTVIYTKSGKILVYDHEEVHVESFMSTKSLERWLHKSGKQIRSIKRFQPDPTS